MADAAFEPTDEQRRLVRAFSGLGVTQETLARHLSIDARTLRRHFQDEWDHGTLEVTAKVAQSLLQMATTGKNVAAAIFWMKARAGWTERQRVEHGFGPGGTFAVISGVPRADDLSDAELLRIARSGLPDDDDEQPPRHPAGAQLRRSYVINPPPELTVEEWMQQCGRRVRDDTAA